MIHIEAKGTEYDDRYTRGPRLLSSDDLPQ